MTIKLSEIGGLIKQTAGDLLLTGATVTSSVARNTKDMVEIGEFRLALTMREWRAEHPLHLAEVEGKEQEYAMAAKLQRMSNQIANSTRKEQELYRELLLKQHGAWAVEVAIDKGQLPEYMRSAYASGDTAATSNGSDDNTNPFASLSEEEDAGNGRKVN